MTTSATTPPRPPKVPRPQPAPLAVSPRISRLAGELAATSYPDQVLAEFWDSVERSGTPLIEPSMADGQRIVTFLWRSAVGSQPAAVYLFVNRLTDERDLLRSSMAHLPGTDLWHLSYDMADDWRASYCFCRVDSGSRDHPAEQRDHPTEQADQVGIRRWLDAGEIDPRNPDQVRGRGDQQMSVVSLPAAPPQPWLYRRPGVPAGSVREHRLIGAGGFADRTAWDYRPADHDGDPAGLPMLVLLDGEVWLNRLEFTTTLDNLIAAQQIPPLRVLLPDSLDNATRWRELAANPDFIDVLADHWLEMLGAPSDPRQLVIAGNSLGGLTAVAAVLRRPDRFRQAISMSGSTWWDADDSGSGLLERWAAAAEPDQAQRDGCIELQVGRQEWVLAEPTRTLAQTLRRGGWHSELVEYNGGHDFAWWRGSLADGLIRWADRRTGKGTTP